MTDQQILTIAIAVIFPLAMLIYSNSRITDTKEILRAEMGGVRAEMALSFERMTTKLDQLENKVDKLNTLFEEHLRVEHGYRGK